MKRRIVHWVHASGVAALLALAAGCAGQGPYAVKSDAGHAEASATSAMAMATPAPDECPPDSGFCERRPTGNVPPAPLPHGATGVPRADHDDEGAVVARHLLERYNDAQRDCRGLPALLCSGVLLRTAKRGPGFDIWNPNPNNPQPKGVSFAWARKDISMLRFPWNYNTGFMILPYFYADDPSDGYTQLTVLCAFPVDGGTDARTSPERDGCGRHPSYLKSEGCQALGITTSALWMAAYGNGALYGQQCFFNLKPGVPDAAAVFSQFSAIRNALGTRGYDNHIEVKIGVWTIGDKRIPLEAFFYQAGTQGVAEAKANQSDFFTKVGRWVPVIRVTLPTQPGGAASFQYVSSDQQIP